MGIVDKLFGEFVDIIEWTDDSSDTMVYRFERYGNEIKYGAMLTVRESQTAVLVSEGRVADFYEPGLYRLETRNMPILTTLESWPHGFSSPFNSTLSDLFQRHLRPSGVRFFGLSPEIMPLADNVRQFFSRKLPPWEQMLQCRY